MSDSSRAADRNLLFGILALQMDFIDRDALIAAMHAWVLAKDKSLGELLVQHGQLRPEFLRVLEQMVAAHLQAHADDPHESLAALSSDSRIRAELGDIEDADLQASLAVAGASKVADPDATGPEITRSVMGASAALRYRIVRPHARGGLGEVFVAEDEELHRMVALKEIQERHAHDSVSRDRFLLEAEVTGGLEHPGIVPVYGMGQYADGRPFYAMRFVKGDNLKEAIRRFHEADVPGRGWTERSLAFRQLLRRFLDVCNAVAYAHSRGVLHRDLKPGNIMLGKYGETLVVDWGLAKASGRADAENSLATTALRPSSDSGAGLTQAGAVIGTPAYMSPEQADGRLDELGPRSDVYSLGATLYTLLAGKPPFAEREDAPVIEQVRHGDFPPPRAVKASVPAALDAICRKAMSLRPEDRYASARGLADDIEHWLADEPVGAYREPALARISRWARHHRPLVAAAAALLLTATVALAISTALVRKQEVAALAAKEQAERERDRADGNFRLAKEAVEQTVTRVAENPRLKVGDFQELRKTLLASAVPFYERFVLQVSDDPALEAERGKAYQRLALVRKEMGELEAARADCEQALDIFTRLAAEYPSARIHWIEKASVTHALAEVLKEMGNLKEAEAVLRAALDETQRMVEQDPTDAELRHRLAQTRNSLGSALRAQGNWKAAEREYRSVGKEIRGLVKENPDSSNYLELMASTHNNLGVLLMEVGKPADAEVEYRSALKAAGRLVSLFPTNPSYRNSKVVYHQNLGNLLSIVEQRPAAEAEFRTSLKELQRLVDEQPAVPAYRLALGRCHTRLGDLLVHMGKPVETEAEYRAALKELQQLSGKYPDVPVYRDNVADARSNLGGHLTVQRGFPENS